MISRCYELDLGSLCLNSDPPVSTATPLSRQIHSKRAFAVTKCTFCATCVEVVLHNVCPNCGGGFVPRPIRPSKNWKGDNFLGEDPASTKVRHKPVDAEVHARFAAAIKAIPPHER